MLSRKFVVHPSVDLDAVVSLALLGACPEEIFFVPAGAKELPADLAGARVVDHPLGEKGRLDADGTRHAAACSLPEAAGVNPTLLAEVDEQDSTGLVKEPRFSLASIFAAVKAAKSVEGLTGEAFDRAVYTAFRPVVDGLNLLHKRMEEARVLVAGIGNIRTVEIGDFKVAVLPGEQPPAVGFALNELGYSAQLFADGNNIGVFRYPGRNTPDLRKLAPWLDVPVESIGKNQTADGRDIWFLHPAGFLAAWGSKKSPAAVPSPEGTPRTVDELVRMLVDAYSTDGCSQCRRDPAYAHINECGKCVDLREEEFAQRDSDSRAHKADY